MEEYSVLRKSVSTLLSSFVILHPILQLYKDYSHNNVILDLNQLIVNGKRICFR